MIASSSNLGTQIANDTTLPGGSSLILSKLQNIQASTPNSSTSASHPVHCALLQLEKVIGTKKHLYVNRSREGCDLPDGSIYNAWKTLHND